MSAMAANSIARGCTRAPAILIVASNTSIRWPGSNVVCVCDLSCDLSEFNPCCCPPWRRFDKLG
ncbi:hypothetical protein BD311DRAFT_283899 [Dichomitus squalens]|uniref:Uncharacterized protein n=1 Tax=Dichomitus squalens TaxID=114155 RepID=A0A4Q9N6H2_9APHY|nr:hypothetical protein BD311DRAFT_283899 [Dichomitus squalens]